MPADSGLWKTCGWKVETLLKHCWRKKFCALTTPHFADQFSEPGVFVRAFACGSVTAVRHSPRFSRRQTACVAFTVNVHRYEENIAGRTYFIEVRPITDSRWRAQIARRPGMPTALMPFYGPTPEEAARELSRWLTLVYNGSNRQ